LGILRIRKILTDYLDELIARGKAKREQAPQQPNYKTLAEALTLFKQALDLSARDPQSSPKERMRLYQRLTDTSTDCSICAPNAKDRLRHVKEADQYGEASLKAAKETGNRRMVLQAEFMRACVGVWELCVRGHATDLQKDEASDGLQDCFDALSREPSLDMTGFERRRLIFLGYLAED
jgi:hypothetical protein